MNNKVKFLRGTATEYEASTKDNDTFYYTTDDEKLYLGNKEITGGSVTIDDALSDTSKNPVQNKVINAALNSKANLTDIPTSLPANGGNADTVDRLHASDFYQIESGLRTEAVYYDIFSTTLSSSHACWNKWCHVVGNSSDTSTSDYINNAPESGYGALWYEVFTGGDPNRAFQIAIGCFAWQNNTFIRYQQDGNWSGWKNIADGGNAQTLGNHSVSDFVLKSDYDALAARVSALEGGTT